MYIFIYTYVYMYIYCIYREGVYPCKCEPFREMAPTPIASRFPAASAAAIN